jgi:putative NADPH-quinone reductase
MPKHIIIIQGHPTSSERHFCHALEESYAAGATRAGHEVRHLTVAELDFAVLRSKAEWDHMAPAPAIASAQDAIRWADHLVVIYPLWLGAMPALLKGFLEQVFRPGFGVSLPGSAQASKTKLAGRSTLIVVTLGMPAFIYRWYFGAHSLRSLKRNILAFVGIKPNRHTLIGRIEGMSNARRKRWLATMEQLGERAR